MGEQSLQMMLEPDAVSLLRSYGIDYPEHGVAHSAVEAVALAERIGYPVVMKIVSPHVIHKSDVGGVRLGLAGPSAVYHTYGSIVESIRARVPHANVAGIMVCRQAPPGLELVIGMKHDDIFGPTVMFGLGGVFVEVLQDVSMRVCPVGRDEALSMIKETKGYEVLSGTRGKTRLDIDSVVELVVRVSTLVEEHPQVREIDLNPIMVYETGLAVLDARILVTAQPCGS